METENVTKTELKYIQLVDKLEQNNEKLENKVKQFYVENTDLLNKSDELKKQNVKLTTANDRLLEKVSELETQCKETMSEAQSHIDSLDEEIQAAHHQIFEIRNYVLNNNELLLYFGKKADVIFDEAFNKGLNILKHDYLLDNDFPLPLLIELTDEDFGIITTNYKLVKFNDTDYKLTKNSSKNGNKIEIK